MSSSSIKRQSGFSLLEVLVAFIILSLSLGVIMRLFSGSLRNIAVSEQSTQAVAVAESALASLGVETPLAEGEVAGEAGQGYRWQARIHRYDDADTASENLSTPLLYQVDLTVARADAPALTLTTLRLAPRP